jgi:superfamily II DNA or RNA helicase
MAALSFERLLSIFPEVFSLALTATFIQNRGESKKVNGQMMIAEKPPVCFVTRAWLCEPIDSAA